MSILTAVIVPGLILKTLPSAGEKKRSSGLNSVPNKTEIYFSTNRLNNIKSQFTVRR